ncbi:hypothetical protein D3C79_633090 [compost metagenome]
MDGRVIRQRNGMHALPCQALDFSGGGLHVPPRYDHQRDETARSGVAPVVQVPVVIGLDCSQRHGAVAVHLKALPGKTREGGEAQGAQYAVSVHVVDTVLDVPGATTHLVVAQRLHAVFLFRPADYRVQAHVAGGLLFEHPDVALAFLDHMRLAPLEAGRHMAGKGIGRLNRVVIDTDENQIFNFHGYPLRIRACCCE